MRLKVNGWDTGLRFSAAHFIPSHDKCSRLHGHDYCIDITVEGSDNGGFIIDFDILKQHAREVIYKMDHHVLVPSLQTSISYSLSDDSVNVSYNGKKHVFAKEDVFFVDVDVTSSEQMSAFILEKLASKLRRNKNISRLEVCLYEGPGQGACTSRDMND
ncbi:MAG: 6-pyruvoyl trahydropterin synthase family protein [Thermoplasmata archaeon]